MRTCSQKNIEENSGRTKAGFHPECEATYVDPQSPLVFNWKNQAGSQTTPKPKPTEPVTASRLTSQDIETFRERAKRMHEEIREKRAAFDADQFGADTKSTLAPWRGTTGRMHCPLLPRWR
jgi:hypothetical protein